MSQDGSVTGWMHRLVSGDDEAANQLWQRYAERLQRLASRHLRAHPRRSLDEEDVVVSAFHLFCQGVRNGRFPELHDRDNLWRLLVVMTARKAADHAKYEARRRPLQSCGVEDASLQEVIGSEPSPEFAAMFAEECDVLLEQLGDSTLQRVALLRLDGYSQPEIADRLGISLRSVERKLQRIRQLWGDRIEDE